MEQQTITAPSGRPYVWTKPTPPTEADWKALQEFEAQQGPYTAPAQQASPAKPARIVHKPSFGRGPGGYDPVRGQKNFLEAAPLLGGVAAAAATGGASIPVQLGAVALGAAGGQLLKDSQWDDLSAGDRLKHAALAGLGGALGQGAGAVVGLPAKWAGNKLTSAARALWLRHAKVGTDVANKSQVAKTAGVPAAKDAIAETVLESGHGTLGRPNADAFRETLDALDTKLDAIISGSSKFVKRQDIRNEIKAAHDAIPPGTAASDAEREALQAAFVRLNQQPANIPIKIAQALKRTIYRTRNYAATAKDSADASADKVVGRSLRKEIAGAEPDAAVVNAEFSKQIPAASAMEKAATRLQNSPPADLHKMVALAVLRPLPIAGAILNDPYVGSWTAQQIYKVGKALPSKDRNPANIIRVLQALWAGKDEE